MVHTLSYLSFKNLKSNEVNDFIAGAIGGAASIASSYPMDTIKVRLQTTDKYNGMIDCFKKMRAAEGFKQ